jgi:hypothetical protein
MRFIDLAPELLFNKAAFLSQADLLNIAITCKHLRDVTRPELYREYNNAHRLGRSFRPFVLRLIERPELAKHVHRVSLRAYQHVGHLDPCKMNHEDAKLIEDKAKSVSEGEYQILASAAVRAGVIDTALPFEAESSIVKRMNSDEYEYELDPSWGSDWYELLFEEDGSETADSRFRDQFCKTLRMGMDEPLVVLLLALVPKLRELNLYGMPNHSMALPWRNNHNFKELERITAGTADPTWSLGLLTSRAFSQNLKYLEVHSAGFVRPEEHNPHIPDQPNIPGWDTRATEVPMCLPPNSTSITHLTLQYCTLSRRHMGELLYVFTAYKLTLSTC